MSNKIKNPKPRFNFLQTLGMTMMSLASIAGFFEFTDHRSLSVGRQVLVPAQTVLASQAQINGVTTPINKEKEEVAPEYVSFSEIQRTAPRAAKY